LRPSVSICNETSFQVPTSGWDVSAGSSIIFSHKSGRRC
jgi:hypothetical protein